MTILKNLRRAAKYHPDKAPRCLACGKRREWLGRLPGDAPVGCLTDQNFQAGLCSWECFAAFYNLLDEHGKPTCRCGAAVSVIGAECIPCQQLSPEDERYVYNRAFLSDGVQAPDSP